MQLINSKEILEQENLQEFWVYIKNTFAFTAKIVCLCRRTWAWASVIGINKNCIWGKWTAENRKTKTRRDNQLSDMHTPGFAWNFDIWIECFSMKTDVAKFPFLCQRQIKVKI